jgi:hypothetical protein
MNILFIYLRYRTVLVVNKIKIWIPVSDLKQESELEAGGETLLRLWLKPKGSAKTPQHLKKNTESGTTKDRHLHGENW